MSLFKKLAGLGGVETASKTFTYEHEATSTKMRIDGEEVDAADIDDKMLNRVVTDLGVSPESLAAIHVDQGASSVLRSAAVELAEVREKAGAKVDCPQCNRSVVNRMGSCMYCGAALAGAVETVVETGVVPAEEAAINEVDRQFLDSDVEPAEAHAEVDSGLEAEDAYLQRLRRM